MKRKFLIFVCLITTVLTSCPGMYKVPHYYSFVDSNEKSIIPGETIEVFCVISNQDENDWKHYVRLYVNKLDASTSYGIKCIYGSPIRPEEISSTGYQRSIFQVPMNVSICVNSGNLIYNYLERKKIIYPSEVTLSQNEAHIGDEISVTCAKPVFDVATFSKDKMKLLEEINYCPIWVKKRGDVNSWISIPIEDCTADSAYHIAFTVPENAVSNQILVLNEGGFEYDLHPDFCDVEETKNKYINFNSTSCEKYAYYASKTELLILDASGDRVD